MPDETTPPADKNDVPGSGTPSPKDEGSGGLGSRAGETPASWRESLHEDFRNNPAIQQIKAETPQEALNLVAKQMIDAQKLIGAQKIPALKAEATPEEKAQWRQKYLGAPESPDKYEFPEKISIPSENAGGDPTEIEVDPASAETMRALAHKYGLDPEQAGGILQEYTIAQAKAAEEGRAEVDKAISTGLAELRDEWGADFKNNLDLANNGFQRVAPESLQKLMAKYDEVANDPGFIKIFADLGRQMLDHDLKGGGQVSFSSPTQAKGALEAFNASPEWAAYLKGEVTGAQAESLKARRMNLFQQAYPS